MKVLRVLSRLVIVGCDSVITTNNLYREKHYRDNKCTKVQLQWPIKSLCIKLACKGWFGTLL